MRPCGTVTLAVHIKRSATGGCIANLVTLFLLLFAPLLLCGDLFRRRGLLGETRVYKLLLWQTWGPRLVKFVGLDVGDGGDPHTCLIDLMVNRHVAYRPVPLWPDDRTSRGVFMLCGSSCARDRLLIGAVAAGAGVGVAKGSRGSMFLCLLGVLA